MSEKCDVPMDSGPMDVEDSVPPVLPPQARSGNRNNPEVAVAEEVDLAGEGSSSSGSAVLPPPPADRGPEMDMEVGPGPLSPKIDTIPMPPNFDLEAYISRYTGYTKFKRLDWMSQRCPELAPDCYRMALGLLKQGTNTIAYRDITARAQQQLGSDITLDREWVEQVDRRYQQTLDRLEADLNSYKTNLIKESIRMGYNELGDVYYKRGDLDSALKCYARTRDYCTTNRHSAEMCLHVIELSIDMANFVHVNNYVIKADHTADLEPGVVAKLRATAGLVSLEQGDYAGAASKFLEVSPDLGTSFSGVIVPEDVGVYGGLCALATFHREEVKRRLLDNAAFKNFLDLIPQVRELIHDFANSRYKACLGHLASIRGELDLDLHLHSHVTKLYKNIEDKCLMQYFSPYTSVKLSAMSESLGMQVPELEKKVAALIIGNQMLARIDSKNSTLHGKHADQRSTSYRKVLEMGDNYQRELRAMLLRMSCIENDFIVRGHPGGIGMGMVTGGNGGGGAGAGIRGGGGGGSSGSGGGSVMGSIVGGMGSYALGGDRGGVRREGGGDGGGGGGAGGGPMGMGMGSEMLEDDEHGGGGANAQQPSEGGGGSSTAGIFRANMDTMG